MDNATRLSIIVVAAGVLATAFFNSDTARGADAGDQTTGAELLEVTVTAAKLRSLYRYRARGAVGQGRARLREGRVAGRFRGGGRPRA